MVGPVGTEAQEGIPATVKFGGIVASPAYWGTEAEGHTGGSITPGCSMMEGRGRMGIGSWTGSFGGVARQACFFCGDESVDSMTISLVVNEQEVSSLLLAPGAGRGIDQEPGWEAALEGGGVQKGMPHLPPGGAELGILAPKSQ